MKKQSKIMMILVITIIIILLVLVGLMTFKAVTSKHIKVNKDENQRIENSVKNDNDDKNSSVNKKTNLLDISKLEKYKNFDGSYGEMKSFYNTKEASVNNHYYEIELTLDGKVNIKVDEEEKRITNIKNAIDILEMKAAGVSEAYKYYILQDNGDVYCYQFSSIEDGIYTATKVKNVSNVAKLINFEFNGQENAGGVWGVLAITRRQPIY